MIAVIKTNNPVTISYARSVLNDEEIDCYVADTHASIIEGSIGAIPQRVMVLKEDAEDARKALSKAGLEAELCES
ncbi:MAG: DUF2007 domain-containing protein [Acidimicrobiales bacterium]|nr:DUF2007 domain-containing protein [Hyphomonadaceae bacterium]RZV42084.1 MAG: DUF2007 domain-containing protein [Acidimicrobiales bacterium]